MSRYYDKRASQIMRSAFCIAIITYKLMAVTVFRISKISSDNSYLNITLFQIIA